jgi:hypothetical protein
MAGNISPLLLSGSLNLITVSKPNQYVVINFTCLGYNLSITYLFSIVFVIVMFE